MQNEYITNKLDMFGNLIRELQYWNRLAEDESTVEGHQYCDAMFLETLEQAREMHPHVIQELDNYFQLCRAENIPIDISYYRISKELKEYSF
jgi:hypothetical protein